MDLEDYGLVLHDGLNDIVHRFGVVVMGELCTFIDDQLEKVRGELPFASSPDIPPHVNDENNVLQGRVTANPAEHFEVMSRGPRESLVGNTVDVDNSSEL